MTKKSKTQKTQEIQVETQEVKSADGVPQGRGVVLSKESKEMAEVKSVAKTQAQLIWDEIKDLEISMFGLPEQKINNFCSPVFLDDKILFLNYKLAAVFPVLEEKFRAKYLIDTEGKMLKVSRV